MQPINPLVLLCLAGTLFSAGCASVRVETDLVPKEDPALQSAAGHFHIAGMDYSRIRKTGASRTPDLPYQEALLRTLQQESIRQFPALFTDHRHAAIPLWISVTDANSVSDKTLYWMFGSLLTVPIIFPMPARMERLISIETGIWNGSDGFSGTTARSGFSRKEHAWTSLTPLALIPIPGDSDLPKESLMVNINETEPFFNMVGYRDLPVVARQIATAVAQIVAEKEADYWTMQPRYAQPTGYSPSPSAAGTPPPAPDALPLPTDTPSPF